MEFLKNHYEKVLLSVVLLALAVVAALLPSRIKSTDVLPPEPPRKNAYKEPDVSTNKLAMEQCGKQTRLEWAGIHNLFNPNKWKRRPDGRIEKIESRAQEGPQVLEIIKITPLYYVLAYEGAVGGGNNYRYQFSLLREADSNPNLRRKISTFASLGDRTEQFSLKDLTGPTESPSELRLELTNGVVVNISKEAPYKRVDGYTVDLRYPPEDKVFRDKRKGDAIVVSGETNNIVAIYEDKVVLSANPTGERTTVTNFVKKAAF
jgi:hypothetical protein